MSKRKAKFRVGQVVAYRRADEVAYRYGRIHRELSLTLNDTGDGWIHGFRLLDGVLFVDTHVERMRPLTRREKGD